MKVQHQYLLLLLLLTFLFATFVFSGSLLWAWHYPRGAIICFILCMPTLFGQLVCIWHLSRLPKNHPKD